MATRSTPATDDEEQINISDLARNLSGHSTGPFRQLDEDARHEKEGEERRRQSRPHHQNLGTIDLGELNQILDDVQRMEARSGRGILPTRRGGRVSGNLSSRIKHGITDEEARKAIVFQRGIIVPREGKGGRLSAKVFSDMSEDGDDLKVFSTSEFLDVLKTTLNSLQTFQGPLGKEWVRSFQEDGNFVLITVQPGHWAAHGHEDGGEVRRKPLCKPFKLPSSLAEQPQDLNQLQLHYLSLTLACLRTAPPAWLDARATLRASHLHRPGHLLLRGGHRPKQ